MHRDRVSLWLFFLLTLRNICAKLKNCSIKYCVFLLNKSCLLPQSISTNARKSYFKMAILTVVILFVKNKSDQALSRALNSGVKGPSSPLFPFEDTVTSEYPPTCSSMKMLSGI